MLDLKQIKQVLTADHLLVDSQNETEKSFSSVTYDSRTATTDSLFFCKGNFEPKYLTMAREKGATAYVSEVAYPNEGENITAIIVTDIAKAMSLLGAEFYGRPQDFLFITAFTGTKGKTTSAYLTHEILKNRYPNETALFSTIDRIVGPHPDQQFKSHLTTPESLDLFHDMREAVDSGMTHLVMEVSSQAYKRNRVYGLTFDVGVFLNISPDHIGKNEHPTFEDYLECKEQLMVNSRFCVINQESDHFNDFYQVARETKDRDHILTFAREGHVASDVTPVDVTFKTMNDSLADSKFAITAQSDAAKELNLQGHFALNLVGDYNESNATAAMIVATLVGATLPDVISGFKTIVVPGRMESLKTASHGTIYVDYAHNYASMHALLRFLKAKTQAGRVIVVVGSTGDKGVSRREGFGKALTEAADVAILTTDDPGHEDPKKIADEIAAHTDQKKVDVSYVQDRATAIKQAIIMGTPDDIVVLAGKGEDAYQKINGVDTPYETDMVVAKNVVKEL